MIAVSQLGRLGEADASGYDLSYSNAAFDAPSSGASLPPPPPPMATDSEDGLKSTNPYYTSEQKVALSNQTLAPVPNAGDESSGAGDEWLSWLGTGKKVTEQAITAVVGPAAPVTPPPPSTGMSGGMMALLAVVGVVAVVGVGYAVAAS